MKNIYLLSLGCPRNLVDSEVLQGRLEQKGFALADGPEGADVAIVNTCGFIEDAKQESIDYILRLAEFKKEGKLKKLVVAGCLAQRYASELMGEVKEIDGLFGTADFLKIPDMISLLAKDRKIKEVSPSPDFLYGELDKRKLITPSHYAYVKIQEGCSNKCSYCVIPDLRGPCRSRKTGSVLSEIKTLRKEHGVKEIILIGQDTTSFGIDRGKPELANLLREASSAMGDGWVRLLYTHPFHFTDELIDVISGTGNICKYIDLPIQHASDKILRQMNRRTTKKEMLDLIGRIRKKTEEAIIRTSVIVGFPGETEDDFRELMDLLRKVRFERLGTFVYSREGGTKAAGLKDQVPEQAKKARFDEIMKLQQEISRENNLKYLGCTLKALVDEKDPSDPEQFVARSQMDTPEVDGVIYLKGKNIRKGEFTDARITGTMEYDLIGETA